MKGTEAPQRAKKETGSDRPSYEGARQVRIRASLRAISTARLHASLHFHLRPIDVVVSHGPLKRSHLVAGFAGVCFPDLTHPALSTRRLAWRGHRDTRRPVRS